MTTVLKVKNRMVVWVQNGLKWIGLLVGCPHDHTADWELWANARILRQDYTEFHSLGNDQNSKTEVWFPLNALLLLQII